MISKPLLLSLCDFSGAWSQPYLDRFTVVRIDLGHPEGETWADDGSLLIGADITKLDIAWKPYAVIAAPPCTCFCRPSARWWKRHDASGETQQNIEVMRTCLRICATATGWWALENPPGRHEKLIAELGRPAWQYQPYEYGDPWGKQTYIWGTAVKPPVVSPVAPAPTRRTPNGKTQGRIAFMSSSWKSEREKTPAVFAKAFAEVNL